MKFLERWRKRREEAWRRAFLMSGARGTLIAPIAQLPPGFVLLAPIPENTLHFESPEAWRAPDGSLVFGRWIKIGNDWHRLEAKSTVMLDGAAVIDAEEIAKEIA